MTATEFQINTYEFKFWDNNSICHWDSIRWEFENPNLHWVLEPDSTTHPTGKNLKIYVMEHVNDTVWLKAKVYNRCSHQGVERRYWFVCSFYGIEEDGPSTGSENIGFEVVPNPNNGQMSLNFKHLNGNIEVKVYDMKGSLIDRFMTHSGTDTHSVDYNLKARGAGIYYFVASSKEGTVTQKVVYYP